jgi:cytolysin-activating lysine-acyltransferase
MIGLDPQGYIFQAGRFPQRFEEEIGLAAYLMCQSREYRLFRIACLSIWIEPAIRHRQIMFVFDGERRRIGYFTWALLADDVRRRMGEDASALLHESEWDEGNCLWIMDFVAPMGHARGIIQRMRAELFLEHEHVYWLRRRRDGSIRHVTEWRRRPHASPSSSNAANASNLIGGSATAVAGGSPCGAPFRNPPLP